LTREQTRLEFKSWGAPLNKTGSGQSRKSAADRLPKKWHGVDAEGSAETKVSEETRIRHLVSFEGMTST